MNVQQAKAIAQQWVVEAGSRTTGYAGAFYHGSAAWLTDNAPFPATSDVDVIVAVADPTPPVTRGKFMYRDVLLDVSYLSSDLLQSPEQVLALSHLAGSLRTTSVIDDPTGRLTRLQEAVADGFARRRWVYARCAHAREKVLTNLEGLHEGMPADDQVISCLFAAGVTTHVLLVAGLENPTVRRRYVTVRDLLARDGHAAFYPVLLDLLGCARMSRAQVEQHLAAATAAFDAAAAVLTTPFSFTADLSPSARPIAVDGSRELIERGDHREAMFWIAVTYARSQKALRQDGSPQLAEVTRAGYRRMLADLGLASYDERRRRSAEIVQRLPRVWAVAEALIAANPRIGD